MVRSHQALFFAALSYGFSWWPVLPVGLVLPYGPWLAAIAVIALATGRAGLGEHWRSLNRWRVSAVWYFLAPAIPAVIFLVASLANGALGASIVRPATASSLGAALLTSLQLLVAGGQWEEPGWTGFALRRLSLRLASQPAGWLFATGIVGLIRVGWHLPLALTGAIPWSDMFLYVMALQLLISWAYRASGSVPIAMLLHFSSNLSFALTSSLFTGLGRARFVWLYIAVAWLIVLAVTAGSRAWARKEPLLPVEPSSCR